MEGYVKKFYENKGFGFITDGSRDYFVHYTDLINTGFRTLEKGQEVTFEVTVTPRGLRAVEVRLK